MSMPRRSTLRRRIAAAVAVLALVAAFDTANPSASARTPAPPVPSSGGHGRATPAHLSPRKKLNLDTRNLAPGSTASARQSVFVQLSGTGAAEAWNRTLRTTKGTSTARRSAARSAALARRSQIRSSADRVFATAKARDPGARQLFQVSNAVPGLGMRATTSVLQALAARTDVVKISTIVPKTATNASAAQLTKVLDEWTSTHSTGSGVKVAVIDTGLDFTHADFGGSGVVSDWTTAHATPDAATWYTGLPAAAQAKIGGGYDFVGDDYNAGDAAHSTPVPDPDPIDCDGHGTHVAGTIAGYGVNADGSTFTGDYTTLTGTDLDGMRIGPGMAPQATLYPLKVFGCTGSTTEVIPALDRTLDLKGDGSMEHADVVNLSLGSDYVPADDPENDIVNSIAADGVLPVISMGNAGDETDAGSSPGSATRALAVASTLDANRPHDGLKINTPTGVVANDVAAGQNSSSYDWGSAPVTGDVVQPTDSANLTGCDPFTEDLTGKVVWLTWNDASPECSSKTRADNAHAAGAVGVILTSTLTEFDSGIGGNTVIPVFQLLQAGTDALKTHLGDTTPINVTFDGSLAASIKDSDPAVADTLSSFSSRGTHGSVGVVKPDVAAPGDTIASAGMGTGTNASVLSGTSMAAPHVAGVAALVKAEHPTWSPEQVKAAIMNTANHDVYAAIGQTGDRYGPARVGAGRVDAKDAVDTTLLAYDVDPGFEGGVSASFGVVEAPVTQATVTHTRTVRVFNTGGSSVDVTAAYVEIVAQPGVAYTVSPTGAQTVNPDSSVDFTVTMTVTTANLRHSIDPTMPTSQDQWGRQFLSDASGRLEVTPTTGSTLRVPVYGAAKPVSSLTATSVNLGTTAAVRMGGQGFALGDPEDYTSYTSYTSVMDFGAESPQLPACGSGVTTRCRSAAPALGGDIRYVGADIAAADYGTTDNGYLYFGIAMYGNNAAIGHTTLPYVDIGTPTDRRFRIVAAYAGDSDVLLSWTFDITNPAAPDLLWVEAANFNEGSVDTNVFDTNVIVLSTWPAFLGFSSTDTTFPITYTVGTSSIYGTLPNPVPSYYWPDIDQVGPVSFNLARPQIGVGYPLWRTLGGDDVHTYTRVPTYALVLFLHNASGNRAEKVLVSMPTALSITGAQTINYGSGAVVTGGLTSVTTHAGVAGRHIRLYASSSPSGPWTLIRDLVTAGNGNVTTTVRPSAKTYLRWNYSGDSLYYASHSATSYVLVKQVVSAYPTSGRVNHGWVFKIWGRVSPTKVGVPVYLQMVSGGHWKTVSATRIYRQRLPNGQTTYGYVFSRRIYTHGRYQFRAVVNGYGGLSGGNSRSVYVTIV